MSGLPMRNRWRQAIASRRWLIATAAMVLAVLYGELCLRQRHSSVDLGVHTTVIDGQPVVAQVYPAGLAWAAGIRPGDRVVATTGASGSDAHANPPQSLTVVTATGEPRTVTTSPLATPQLRSRWIAFLVIATLFVAVGTGVFVLSAAGAGSTALLGMSMAAALALLSAIATPTGALWALIGVHVGMVGFATMTCLLFLALAFPQITQAWRRRIYGVCTSVAVLLFTGYALSVLGDGRWYDLVRPWLFGTMLCYLLAACGLSVIALTRTAQRRGERVALKLAVLGVCGGVVPFCLLVLLPGIVGLSLPLPPDLAALSLVALPISLGFAVLTQQWFGVERLARRSIVALAVWSVLLLSYSLALEGMRQQFPPGGSLVAGAVHTTTFHVVLIAGSFPFAQRTLRRWLERQVFHAGDPPAVQFQRLQSALAQARDVEMLTATALTHIRAVLRPTRITLALMARPGAARVYRWPNTNRDERPLQRSDRNGVTPGTWRRFILRAQGQVVGTLAIGGQRRDLDWSPEAADFIAGLLPLLAITLYNALLLERLQHQVMLLGEREYALARLSTQLLQTQEDERRRLAFDLHDDPLQRTILLERAFIEAPKTVQTTRWRLAVAEIATSLRATCASLRPPMLDDLGLTPALAWLVNDIRARSDLNVDLQLDAQIDELPLPTALAVALYRVTQEALNNCLKHANATHVTVTLSCTDVQIQLQVADNGQGCQRAEVPCGRPGLGIAGMHERLRPLGGRLTVGTAPAGGTVVTVTVPH